jgi:hypothetical protein
MRKQASIQHCHAAGRLAVVEAVVEAILEEIL